MKIKKEVIEVVLSAEEARVVGKCLGKLSESIRTELDLSKAEFDQLEQLWNELFDGGVV